MKKTMKKILFITALSLFTFTLSAGEFKAKETKIIGGTKSAFGAWPSTVALLNADTIRKVESGTATYPSGELIPKSYANYQAQFCGASLIDSKWILTAAHCLVDNGVTKKAEKINVLVGASNLIGGGTRKTIKKVIIHPDFNEQTADNDIALLELDSSTNVSTIKVSNAAVSNGTLAMVVGWGALSDSSTLFPSELYEVELPLVDRQVCVALYGSTDFTGNMICAGYEQGGKDTCKGDSGGPLMARINGFYQQIGITSWGVGCAKVGLYGAYTRLSKYKSWISSKTTSSESGGGSLFFLLIPLFFLTISRRKYNKQ